ncbi:GxxExxY protein [Chitinophaga sp. MM2321]|uniref:GxxExxY protein n=1 Tax=Chitinophaga sp. MM2321 TaxID=3137178 RepID=UPI0032D56AF5
MNNYQPKFHEITGKIIGCAMKTHRILGNGFQEFIYQRALEIEMQKEGVTFEREKAMLILYQGVSIGTRRVDFLVEERLPIELKAIIKLEAVHLTQALNYLEIYNKEIGLLINFGSISLEFKRLYNGKFNENISSSSST